MPSNNTLAIGNFALSDIYSSGELVTQGSYGGICFRVALVFAFIGVPLDCFSIIGEENEWEEIIQILGKNKVNLIQNSKAKKSLRFDWFYEKGNKLNDLLIHNGEMMDQVASSIDEEQLQRYSSIILCSLGFQNERQIIKKMSKSSRLTYIFHKSNLENALPEDYLSLFEKVDNLFLNEEEAYALTNTDNLTAAGKILSKKTRCFITLGEKGSSVFDKEKLRLKLPAVKVTGFNSAGAGDTYAGGVLAALSLDFDLTAACRLGSLLASATVNDYLTSNLQRLLQ